MNETFEIGEVAILWKPGAINHGKECTIIGPLQWMIATGQHSGVVTRGYMYQIEYGPDFIYGPHHFPGSRQWVLPEKLRKKRPPEQPREQLGEWELCPWQPNKKVVRS